MNTLAMFAKDARAQICREALAEIKRQFERQNIACPPMVLSIDDGSIIWSDKNGTTEQAQTIIRHVYRANLEKDVPPCHKKP